MNKKEFRLLRSEFRKMRRDAFLSAKSAKHYIELVNSGEMEFSKRHPTNFFFEWFDKPTFRQKIVSMNIFNFQGCPFERFE
ncbi:hypothetical protein ACN1T7_001737 [Vibrio cholerae]